MQYIYAALLLHSAKQEINESNIKKVIEATGAKSNDAQVKALIASLDGVNIEDAISKAAVTPVATPVAGTPAPAEEKEEKKEEKSAEEKSAEAAGGLAALFG